MYSLFCTYSLSLQQSRFKYFYDVPDLQVLPIACFEPIIGKLHRFTKVFSAIITSSLEIFDEILESRNDQDDCQGAIDNWLTICS